MKRRLTDGKKLELILFFCFAAAYVFITLYHEPWFDEAQSWQIAKCASIKDMLFEIPHYEGHPPLWWLILAIPAKLGVPFELGLKSIGFILSVSCVFLILFKLPYPRVMRLVLPFTYFIFYQYGIIVRPYGIMLLSFLLLVLAFPERDRHPWRFTGLLMLLCLSSAYGIVMAGGIAICRVWELVEEKGVKGFISGLFRDRRTLALGALLAVAVLLILEIMPRDDTYIASQNATNSVPLCLLCALLTFLSECTITTSSWFSIDTTLLQNAHISSAELILMCMVGCLLWVVIIGASSKRHLRFLLVPYILLSVFASFVYFSVHHVGVALLLLLFWTGTLFQDDKRFEIGRSILNRIAGTARDRKLLKYTAYGVCALCLAIPAFWSVSASVLEVRHEYSYGRHAASFLDEHNLQNSLVFSVWGMSRSADDSDGAEKTPHNTSYVASPVVINAYYDHNICMNLNCGSSDEAYMHYRIASDEEDAETIEKWRSAGIPDIILGRPQIDTIFEGTGYDDYTLVDAFPINYIWKTQICGTVFPVYARNDILQEHGLDIIADEKTRYWLEGFTITEEMREQYRNGVPAEEILKPYLDAMFGEQD